MGSKAYELSDHLGNVTVTVSDLKRELPNLQLATYGIATLSSTEVAYAAQVLSYTNYYAFGMSMPGRNKTSEAYRYGFNGKENDKEWGTGLIQDYGFRLYNPSIAKFLSVDPLAPSYPWYTPYQFAGNKPIQYIDLDGLEPTPPPHASAAMCGHMDTHDAMVGKGTTRSRAKIAAVGTGVAILVAVDMYFGGYGTMFLMAYQAGSIHEKVMKSERTNDPIEREQLQKEAGEETTSLVVELGTGVALKASIKALKYVPDIKVIREKLARAFLSKSGATNLDRHIAAINLESAVYTETLKEGTAVWRYTDKTSGAPKNYFLADDYVPPGAVGKQSMYNNPNIIVEKYTLTKDVKVLRSTTDLAGEAGAPQIYSTEIEHNSIITEGW